MKHKCNWGEGAESAEELEEVDSKWEDFPTEDSF